MKKALAPASAFFNEARLTAYEVCCANEVCFAQEEMGERRARFASFLHFFISSVARYFIPTAGDDMRDDKLSVQSMDFAVSTIRLVRNLKIKKESIISNQIGRSGTSIGANIREAQYAHSKADFIAKLQIALKEANETGYWLELLYKTEYIEKEEYQKLDAMCSSIRVMLISSINTAKRSLG